MEDGNIKFAESVSLVEGVFIFAMTSFRKAREKLIVAYTDNLISDEELCFCMTLTSQRIWSFRTTSMTSLILVTFGRTNFDLKRKISLILQMSFSYHLYSSVHKAVSAMI